MSVEIIKISFVLASIFLFSLSNSLPSPTTCTAFWTENENGNSIVRFQWDEATFGVGEENDYTYYLSYWVDGEVQRLEFSTAVTSKDVSDYDQNRRFNQTAGTIQTKDTGSQLSVPAVDCISDSAMPTVSPSEKPSSMPSMSPSKMPTEAPTWSEPYLFIGGDICANPRCECYEQDLDCQDEDIFTSWALGSSQILRFEQRDLDFGLNTQISWSLEYLGALSNSSITSYDASLVDPDVSTNFQITPSSGSLEVSVNSDGTSNDGRQSVDVSASLLEEVAVFLFRISLDTCSVNNTNVLNTVDKMYNCSLVYPSELYVLIDTSDPPDEEVINLKSKEETTWLWWVIIAAGGAAVILAFVIYRFWVRNKKTKESLAEKQGDLEMAIEEAENGWGGDVPQTNVAYNPMAVGNASTQSTQANGEYGENQNHAIQDRADVTIEKFHQKAQFGQVRPQARGEVV